MKDSLGGQWDCNCFQISREQHPRKHILPRMSPILPSSGLNVFQEEMISKTACFSGESVEEKKTLEKKVLKLAKTSELMLTAVAGAHTSQSSAFSFLSGGGGCFLWIKLLPSLFFHSTKESSTCPEASIPLHSSKVCLQFQACQCF